MKTFPDTNVWISWLGGRTAAPPQSGLDRYQVFLTTIALQELWAGLRSRGEARDLNALLDVATRRRRLVNPPAAAWIMTGRALRQLASRRRLGAARLGNLRTDVLLAATALAHGAAVLTYNRADFTLISTVLPVEFRAPERAG